MPDPTALTDHAEDELSAPIAAYFDRLDAGADPNGPALARVKADEKDTLLDMFNAAGVLGSVGATGGQPIFDSPLLARLQTLKAEQLIYLRGFMDALPNMSRAAAIARAVLYARSISQAVSELATIYIPVLPFMPGGSNLDCKFLCRCHLDIQKLESGSRDYDITWLRSIVDSCPTCIMLGEEWTPLMIREGKVVNGNLQKSADMAEAYRTWLMTLEGGYFSGIVTEIK